MDDSQSSLDHLLTCEWLFSVYIFVFVPVFVFAFVFEFVFVPVFALPTTI